MRYFISAGEASGDIHAAQLINQIKAIDPDAQVAFLGGDEMAEAAATSPVIDYRRMAFMGFSEVLRNLPTIFSNLSTAKKAIANFQPDALILVDYPSFNLKLARYAASLSIPVYYFIAPKVWAWKSWRVKAMKRLLRKVFAILPFEKDWFASRGLAVDYVGNPSVEEIEQRISSLPSREEFFTSHGLDPQRPLLALVPGSRRGEIRCNLPIMAEVASRHPSMQAIVAGAPAIDPSIYAAVDPNLKVVYGATTPLMKYAEAALVTSGTATLECALCATPQVACYRANGSHLSYNLMSLLIKSPFVTLPNLITGREVIPEMLVHLCTPDAVDARLCDILPGSHGRDIQLAGYTEMRSRLGNTPAAATAARFLINDLTNLKK